MDPFRGIKVELISDGRTLDLYDDPEADQTVGGKDPYTRVSYVEAVTGAKFATRIILSNLFDLSTPGPDDAVRFQVVLDGLDNGFGKFLTRQHIERQIRAKGEALCEFERGYEYCRASGQWTRGNTAFSAMATEESDEINVTPEQIRKLGSIQITIQRTRRTRRDKPKEQHWIPNDEPVTSISEKMIKGKAITSIVKLQNVSTYQLGPCRYRYFPLDGEAGKKLSFEVRYRSRQNLQSLGCILKTPTPERDLRGENRALRQRLALLERNSSSSNVKAESLRPAASIKRECEREEAGDRRDCKRPRGLSSEVVDLTEESASFIGGSVDLTGD